MKPIKDMDNLKKESKKAFKKLYKKLEKRDDIIAQEQSNPSMRHTPSEKEQAAHEKFKRFLITQEKFILVDIATILDIGKEQPDNAAKTFKANKQVRIESKSFKQVLSEILETNDLRDTLDKGLEIIEEKNVII